jgi:hypothetical protein
MISTSFPVLSPGVWQQIAEYREERQSLVISCLVGGLILCPSTQGSFVNGLLGISPNGVFSSAGMGTGPAVFRLSKELDGDLVKQAWWAWLIPSTLIPPSGPITLTFISTSFFTVPVGVTSLNLETIGSGGFGQPSAMTGSGGGGGGGAYAAGTIAVTPGQLITIQASGGGTNLAQDGQASWISGTGFAPVAPADGVLADGGLRGGGDGMPGGIGGQAAASVGTVTFDGGDGGAGVLGVGAGGSGGGGAANAGGAGGAGTDDAGITGVGQPGGLDGGGTGGNLGIVDAQAGVFGGGGGSAAAMVVFGAFGGGSLSTITYTPSVATYPPSIAVLEAFDVKLPPKRQERFMTGLPKLSPEAILALHSLIARVQSENEGQQ